MKSQTIALYHVWSAQASEAHVAFVDDVFALCEKHYEQGGDTVIECMHPTEILLEFTTLADVKEHCGMYVEQALNARWGEADDPQLATLKAFQDWK
jgi:hypothetical protein